MPKLFKSGLELREKILRGANVLADNVASTMGPRGRNVILHNKGGNPIITKDGVTVAKNVDLEDPFENLGAQIIKQASEKTNIDAGDGTTTAAVLSRALLAESQKYLVAGLSPVELKRGMDKAAAKIISELKELARPIRSKEDIESVAFVSANGDKTIAAMIATAVDLVGKDGSITIEDSRSSETSLEIKEGFRFSSGFASPRFITDPQRGVAKFENPLILVTDYKIEVLKDIESIMGQASRASRPLIIISEDISPEALATLIVNVVRGAIKTVAVKAPRYGDERRNILHDLAVATGAEFITRESGRSLRSAKLTDLGTSDTIEVSKSTTVIVGGAGEPDKIDARIDSLKREIEETDNLNECEKIQERIGRLAAGIAVINVGARTEVEAIEKKHRIVDALSAVKAAQLEGIVAGGGATLAKIANTLEVEVENEEQQVGVNIVKAAAQVPLRQMAENAGESPDLILSEVKNSGFVGYDFSKRQVVDLLEVGIVDPVKVTRTALQNAVSAASVLITTNHAIVEV